MYVKFGMILLYAHSWIYMEALEMVIEVEFFT